MKVTRASVESYIENKGFEPIQIDGIPDGFSFKEPNITIGVVEHKGRIIKFNPMKEWEDKDAISYE